MTREQLKSEIANLSYPFASLEGGQCMIPEEVHNKLKDLITRQDAYIISLERDRWQDIETAPKDGTEIIGLMGRKTIRLIWFFRASSYVENWLDANGKKVNPTHWMLLPALPKQGI